MKRRRRKLNTPLIALLFLAACLALAGYYVRTRGPKASDPLAKARRALADRRHAEAEALAGAVLARDPGSGTAMRILIEALVRQEKRDRARDVARDAIERGVHTTLGRKTLCSLALEENDLATVDRMARIIAGADPEFAHRVLALITDHRGLARDDPRQRIEAAATMRGLATLAKTADARASSLLLACEIRLEVAFASPQADVLRGRVREDLAAATAAIAQARQADRRYPADYYRARVRVLSDDPAASSAAAALLRRHTRGADRRARAVAQLALYHLRRGEKTEVLDLLRRLDDTYLWRRVLFVLRRARDTGLARKALEIAGPKAGPFVLADVLAAGSEAERREGLDLLERLVRDTTAPVAVTARALKKYVERAGVEAARRLADEAQLGERDVAVLTVLHALLDDDGERAGAMIRRVADQVGSLEESGSVMRLLGRGALADAYAAEQIRRGGDVAVAHRLDRARADVRRAGGEHATGVRARVARDLRAVLDSRDADRLELLGASRLAVTVHEAELGGRLLGRALAERADPDGFAFRALALVRATEDRELVAEMARGVVAIASDTAAPAFVRTFARVMAEDDAPGPEAVAALEAAGGEDAGSRVPASGLACRLALELPDLRRAERLARAILRSDPDSGAGRELLATALMADGRAGEVVALYGAHAPATGAAHRQHALALLAVGRGSDAVKAAEAALELRPRSIRSSVVLARIHAKNGDERAALSVLNAAPLVPRTALLRAELLERLGDPRLAERTYRWILDKTRMRDAPAWAGLARVMTKMGRVDELRHLVDRTLDAGLGREHRGARAALHYLRAEILQRDGRVEAALLDYEEAIAGDPTLWRAMNNAAWFIASVKPSRIDDAVRHIRAALAIQKGHPSLLDTAAEVYAVKGDWAEALGHADRAIAAVGPADPRQPGYIVHKARILRRAGREAEARALAAGIERAHGGTAAARGAREIIDALDLAERLRRQATGAGGEKEEMTSRGPSIPVRAGR